MPVVHSGCTFCCSCRVDEPLGRHEKAIRHSHLVILTKQTSFIALAHTLALVVWFIIPKARAFPLAATGGAVVLLYLPLH